MAARDMPTFVDALRREGELVEVHAEVDPDGEIAEIHRRVHLAGGPALLFRRVKGHEMPVVTNLFGRVGRVERAFGPRVVSVSTSVLDAFQATALPTLTDLWAQRGRAWGLSRHAPRVVRRTTLRPRANDLHELPFIREPDGRFTAHLLALVASPEGPTLHTGTLQRSTTSAHLDLHTPHHDPGVDCAVSLVVGGPPALLLAARLPLPAALPRLLLAGLFAGEPMRITDAEPPLLCAAEVVVEATMPSRLTGPLGHSQGESALPSLRIGAVHQRPEAIWPCVIRVPGSQEERLIRDVVHEVMAPWIPVLLPGVQRLRRYEAEGGGLASVVVDSASRREAMRLGLRLLGDPQLGEPSLLFVVDRVTDLVDVRALLEHLLCRFNPETDLFVVSNPVGDTGSQALWLGVGNPWRALPRTPPQQVPTGLSEVVVFCGGVLLVSGPSVAQEPELAERLRGAFPTWCLVCLVDDVQHVASSDLVELLASVEPARDLFAEELRIERHHLVYEGTITLDARTRVRASAHASADSETQELVGRRWSEYFEDGGVDMAEHP